MKLKALLTKKPMTLELCRQLVEVADKQATLDTKNKKIQTVYRDVSRLLLLPDRAIKDCKTILFCCDRLINSEINCNCVNKVIAEKSIAQASKVISALNYCKDEDKQLYFNGDISSTELYKRRNATIVATDAISLEERAKRLKDDTETQLTFAMITSMFKSQTDNYLEALEDYTGMVETVTDKRYTRDEALNDITIILNEVITSITSFKEAIINKSDTIMEE